MKNIFTVLFVLCCVILFGQQNVKEVKIIETGELVLVNDEVIPFANLEFSKDKVSYTNTINNKEEFLYRASIKEIRGEEKIIQKKVVALAEPSATEEAPKKEAFKTYNYKDQTIKLPISQDKATVYFVRTSAAGFIISFAYYNGEDFIGEFAGGGYIRYECEPGEHVFWAASENKSFVKANVEAGKIYVIEVEPKLGIVQAQVRLVTMISDNDRKRARQRKRILSVLANNKNDRTPTKEELEKILPPYKARAARGLEVYQKKLKKNKVEFIEAHQDF